MTDPIVAKHLRSRVSYTTYTEGSNPALYDQASFYSYDIHGNVDTLVQDYRTGAMRDAGERFKKLVYQYDLISGKVNEVAYQPGKTDQFYHRYTYYAENRITQAQSSADSIVWERDAMYNYYMHGPLLRTQLGQYKVQGQDYAYTLQGWLKGINGVGELHEIGLDGTNAAVNQFVAKDAYSLMLHYNNNDYSSILNTCYCVSNSVTLPATHSMKALYNGNIAGMSLSIPKLQYPLKTPATRLGNIYYNYKYDQLNRLTRMDAYSRQLISQNSLVYSAALNSYKERVSYDPNGNILTYLRNGADSSSITGLPTGPLAMDSLKYKYYTKTNQLRQVTDNVSSGNYTEDIDNQSDTSNYVYDAIGNLIRDKHEGIDSIHWNVYGKIMSIHKSSGVNIYYTYDAGGNRISKAVLSSTGGIGGGPDTATTWYARDATGNVMSVYTVHRDTTLQDELHLYGSSRLGILKPERNLKLAAQYGQYDSSVSILGTAHGNVFRRGMKFFELANHLGNVLVTISDKKYGYDPGADGNVDYYNPVVMSANDYYPFGMVMPGRKFSVENGYRYGFGGMEKSNEIKGEGNSYTSEFWQYDARLGRRWNIDPIVKQWESPYAAFSNNPVLNIDPKGNSDSVYKTPGGGTLRTESSTAETFDGRAYKVGNVTVKPPKGALRSFREYNGGEPGETSRFVATFNTKTGAFEGYFWDGNMSDSYELFSEVKRNDEAEQQANANNPLYQHYTNRRDALNSAINLSVGSTIPTVIIKPLTIATNIEKVANSQIGRSVADFLKLMKPLDVFDVKTTLYRGTTGSEVGSTVLFLTDDAAVAASYIKNGGSVMKYEMTQFSIKSLEASGNLTFKTGIHGPTGQISREFMFTGKNLVEAVNSLATPLNH